MLISSDGRQPSGAFLLPARFDSVKHTVLFDCEERGVAVRLGHDVDGVGLAGEIVVKDGGQYTVVRSPSDIGEAEAVIQSAFSSVSPHRFRQTAGALSLPWPHPRLPVPRAADLGLIR